MFELDLKSKQLQRFRLSLATNAFVKTRQRRAKLELESSSYHHETLARTSRAVSSAVSQYFVVLNMNYRYIDGDAYHFVPVEPGAAQALSIYRNSGDIVLRRRPLLIHTPIETHILDRTHLAVTCICSAASQVDIWHPRSYLPHHVCVASPQASLYYSHGTIV